MGVFNPLYITNNPIYLQTYVAPKDVYRNSIQRVANQGQLNSEFTNGLNDMGNIGNYDPIYNDQAVMDFAGRNNTLDP